MKKFILPFTVIFFALSFTCFGQEDIPPHIKDHITYPALNFSTWIGVMPVSDPAMTYNPELDYKIALDLYGTVKDSSTVHSAILEVARTYNLNIANGVPAEEIQLAAVIHGGLVQAILNEKEYEAKYGISNPNLAAIKALEEVGVKFYVCGQSMGFLNVGGEKITPMVKMAISAKTTFVTLDQMGYSYLNVSDD
ncbi:DsrE family protein [Algoriphagus sp.]|uniref:DsrE family protein n=1 Tax=Algoriphagus sp. TaxID=1872435 RepID=UPI0025FFBDDC|nr:DsrE family protein [Algoriphagus sp.]